MKVETDALIRTCMDVISLCVFATAPIQNCVFVSLSLFFTRYVCSDEQCSLISMRIGFRFLFSDTQVFESSRGCLG